jgi:hypothetical protein
MLKLSSLSLTGAFTTFLLCLQVSAFAAQTYYIDADGGNDLNSGTSAGAAWATLDKASSVALLPGDRILLQQGDTFVGKLFINGHSGTEANPIEVASYGSSTSPVINASGYLAGVHIRDASHIVVSDLEITGNGGAMVDGSPEDYRYGVRADQTASFALQGITLDNLSIHHIYPNVGALGEGATATTHYGYGIAVDGGDLAVSGNVVVSNCSIENVGFKAIELKQLTFVEILDNQMTDIGGPAIQPSRVNDIVVRGNVVDGSGSFVDSRMHGRGSGIWPWTSDRVLIEKNTFMHARGKADSCGVHIDYNCNDVVVQHNLSIDNVGGFLEILGGNSNSSYRYNISINDGARVIGEESNGPGTFLNTQNGNVIWTSGYVGGGTLKGPYNTYIYNNTIYVKSDITTRFNIHDTSDGLLIYNNIFYVEGPTVDDTPLSSNNYTPAMADRVLWDNNLYQVGGIVPTFNLNLFTDDSPVIGDPLFASTGGLNAADYIPAATGLIQDQGIIVDPIPGDPIGLTIGLPVGEDFFGNPIVGLPDMGAIELGGTLLPLPAAAFSAVPATTGPDSAAMTAVTGPYNTEYYFTETSGNFGGHDSGWQLSPTYVDQGLLPNTQYAYSVTLRNALDAPGSASFSNLVLTGVRDPFPGPDIFTDNFDSAPNPANTGQPFPVDTWYVAYQPEVDQFSVNTVSGLLRIGYGYDFVHVFRFSDISYGLSRSYQFTGNWMVGPVLDVHDGIQVGLCAFDPVTGQRLFVIKEITAGNLVAPVANETGTFSLDVSPAELATAGVTESMLVGVYFGHTGAGAPNRNDVYSVDNLVLVQIGGDVDSDDDNIPDVVEANEGLNDDNPLDALEDADLDGTSNVDEFLAGSGINDPADLFAAAISTSPGAVQVAMPDGEFQPYRLYMLEYSTTMGLWTVLDAVTEAEGGSGPISFEMPAVSGSEFFRIRIEWE